MLSGDDVSNAKSSGASEEELAAMLRWYAEMGVDLAVQDRPRDYFTESREKAARAAEAPAPIPATVSPPARAPGQGRVAPRLTPEPLPVRAATPQGAVSPDEAIAEARQLAAAADSLETLKAALAGFEGCALKRSATHLVFAEGAAGARIVFVGGAPDSEDDRSGQILSGRSGALFDAMLRAIRLDRSRIHMVNLIPWRPAGGKPPTPPEIAICEPFLHRYLALARPEIIVALGDLPTRAVLGAKEPIVRARGKWFEPALPDSQSVAGMAMFHPEYLVKVPAAKRYAWADLRTLRRALAEKGLA